MADIPMSRMDDEGIEQMDELNAAIAKAREHLASATKSLGKVKNTGLAKKVEKVLGLAATLLEQLKAVMGQPWQIGTLVDDFEDQTAAIRVDLHQALNAGDVTVASAASLLAQIREIGEIAHSL